MKSLKKIMDEEPSSVIVKQVSFDYELTLITCKKIVILIIKLNSYSYKKKLKLKIKIHHFNKNKIWCDCWTEGGKKIRSSSTPNSYPLDSLTKNRGFFFFFIKMKILLIDAKKKVVHQFLSFASHNFLSSFRIHT